MRFPATRILAVLTLGLVGYSGVARGQNDELKTRASWTIPNAVEVRGQIDEWLKGRKLGEAAQLQIEAIWDGAKTTDSSSRVLERVALTAAAIDNDAKAVVRACDSVTKQFPKLSVPKSLPAPLQHNLNLYVGAWMARNQFYDEAYEALKDLKADLVVDPAGLLFYRSVAAHRLLKKDTCLKSVKKLLENEDRIPRRFQHVAKMMEKDIAPLKTDSPDEIARLMEDVRRRLDLGRAGKRVRRQEDEIIAKLDKIIKKLEDQQKQQQQQQQQSPSGGQGQPLNDSQALQQKGPGDVDQRQRSAGSAWGNLPPEKRRAALQQISREMGAHYRAVIEEYFRKLARDSE